MLTFIHLFVASFVHLFIRLFARLFVRPFVRSSIVQFLIVRSLACVIGRSSIRSILGLRQFVHAFARSLVLTGSFVWSSVLSFSGCHSLVLSFVCQLAYQFLQFGRLFVHCSGIRSFVSLLVLILYSFVLCFFLRRLLFVFTESTSAQTRCNFNRRLVSFFNNILNVH